MLSNISTSPDVMVTIMMVTITVAMFDNEDDIIYRPIELANEYLN